MRRRQAWIDDGFFTAKGGRSADWLHLNIHRHIEANMTGSEWGASIRSIDKRITAKDINGAGVRSSP